MYAVHDGIEVYFTFLRQLIRPHLLEPSLESVEPLGTGGGVGGEGDDLVGTGNVGVTRNWVPGIGVGQVGGGLQVIVTGESRVTGARSRGKCCKAKRYQVIVSVGDAEQGSCERLGGIDPESVGLEVVESYPVGGCIVGGSPGIVDHAKIVGAPTGNGIVDHQSAAA